MNSYMQVIEQDVFLVYLVLAIAAFWLIACLLYYRDTAAPSNETPSTEGALDDTSSCVDEKPEASLPLIAGKGYV